VTLEKLTLWMFRHRTPLLGGFLLLTALMLVSAARLRVDASFEKSLPSDHEYIRVLTRHQAQLGGANRLLVALMARDGDMFTPEFFAELKRVTDEVTFLPSVDRPQVQSLFTPNVRFIEIVEDGFSGGNVIPADFTPTPENFARVRGNIVKSGRLGQLVANDFSGAVVSGQLLSSDPRTGEKIDYARVASALEAIRTRVEGASGGAIQVHIIGYAKVVGDIRDGARGVLGLFGLSVGVTALLVWFYTGRWRLAFALVVCALVAVAWQLGLLSALGFGIDPLSILIPFLVFAIAVSHGVQFLSAFRQESDRGRPSPAAAQAALQQVIVPGILALLTDTIGFLTIMVIDIPIIQELAFAASLGVSVIILTNFFLLPLLLAHLELPIAQPTPSPRWRLLEAGKAGLIRALRPGPSLVIIGLACLLGAAGYAISRGVRIGDTQAGVPELRPESRYNADTHVITSKFGIGIDVLSVIVETIPNGCVDYDVLTLMDRFEGHVRTLPGVQSVVSLPGLAKVVNAGFSEGSLKWRILPRHPQTLAQAVSPIETSTGLLNGDGSVMPILIFLKDHKAETLQAVTDATKAFAAANPSPKATFHLAGGNAGVMAAVNEVVAAAERPILLWIYGAVFGLCLITFRSWRAAVCIVLPLVVVSFLAYALMAKLGIGLKPSTLPVVALGVGIGVDYGIYIFSRLQSGLRAGRTFDDAMALALHGAGTAVIFTGVTLALGVSTWVLSSLKFQADMGLLLAFMFLVNMVGAIVLLPALARWFWRHPARPE